MKRIATYHGRSLPFNFGFLALNLAAVVLLVMAFHRSFEGQRTLLTILGVTTLLFSIGGLIIFKGRMLMAGFSRILVGGLFIVSGLVKANDPLGFSYKLEEYFEDGALAYRIKEWFNMPGFSLEYFIQHALALSVIICIIEIVLGVLVIIGGKLRFVSWFMLVMMLFFTFLTWHTANCDGSTKFLDRDTYELSNPARRELGMMKLEAAKDNPDIKIVSQDDKEIVVDEMRQPQCVTDCGCFGDAMKGSVGRSLSPAESMWKDIVLLYFVIWIVVSAKAFLPNTSRENMIYIPSSIVVVLFLSWVFDWYFPIFFALVCIVGALWVYQSNNRVIGNHWTASLFVVLVCSLLTGYVLMYDPIRDYRPYSIGSNLKEKMNDGKPGVSETVMRYKNKKTGKLEDFVLDGAKYNRERPWEHKDKYDFDTMITQIIVEMRQPSITEQFGPFIRLEDIGSQERSLPFMQDTLSKLTVQGLKIHSLEYDSDMEVPMNEYDSIGFPASEYKILDTIELANPEVSEINIRDFIVNAPKLVLLSVKDLEKANWKTINNIRSIAEGCRADGIPFVMICNADRKAVNEFRVKHELDIPVFVNDEIELKAISRSNPAVLYIENSVIRAKYPFRSIPEYTWLKKNVINSK